MNWSQLIQVIRGKLDFIYQRFYLKLSNFEPSPPGGCPGCKAKLFSFFMHKFFEAKWNIFHPGPVEPPCGWWLPLLILSLMRRWCDCRITLSFQIPFLNIVDFCGSWICLFTFLLTSTFFFRFWIIWAWAYFVIKWLDLRDHEQPGCLPGQAELAERGRSESQIHLVRCQPDQPVGPPDTRQVLKGWHLVSRALFWGVRVTGRQCCRHFQADLGPPGEVSPGFQNQVEAISRPCRYLWRRGRHPWASGCCRRTLQAARLGCLHQDQVIDSNLFLMHNLRWSLLEDKWCSCF